MSYSILLLLYVLVIAITVVMSIVSLYHLARFAPRSSMTHLSVTIFIVFLSIIFVATWWALREVNWSQQIEIDLPTVTSPL